MIIHCELFVICFRLTNGKEPIIVRFQFNVGFNEYQ
jgi:hypothetical protein